MEKTNYIVGIDIGSSNIVMAVGLKSADGKVVLKAIAQTPSQGVNAGSIENINQLSECINTVKEEIEKKLNIRITEAYAGISGSYIRCAPLQDHVHVRDYHSGVAQSDVDDLYARMKGVSAPDNEVILEYIPQNFCVDNREVKDPVGSFGRRLSSTFNFILCNETPLKRLSMTFKRSGLQLTNTFPNSRIMGNPLLTDDERMEGVAIVDIGGFTTDVAVYHGNTLRHIATIPIGGNSINRDIHLHGVPERSVERLKRDYGSAIAEYIPEQKLIHVPSMSHRSNGGVWRRNLASIIEARLTDIAEYVKLEIKDSGYSSKLSYGIVLTGGSSVIKHIDELFQRVTGHNVRVASVDLGEIAESLTDRNDPACTAVVALLMKAAEQRPFSTIATNVTMRPTPPFVGGITTINTSTDASAAQNAGIGSTAINGGKSTTTPPTAGTTTSVTENTNTDNENENSGDDDQTKSNDENGQTTQRRRGFNFGKTIDSISDWINRRFEKSPEDEEI